MTGVLLTDEAVRAAKRADRLLPQRALEAFLRFHATEGREALVTTALNAGHAKRIELGATLDPRQTGEVILAVVTVLVGEAS